MTTRNYDRCIAELAAYHRERDLVAKCLRVVHRYPVLTLVGAKNWLEENRVTDPRMVADMMADAVNEETQLEATSAGGVVTMEATG